MNSTDIKYLVSAIANELPDAPVGTVMQLIEDHQDDFEGCESTFIDFLLTELTK